MQHPFRYAVSRIIKLFANLTKGPCYIFHLLLPKKRFAIPRTASPLISHNGAKIIPRTVWQTNYTSSVTLPVYLNYLFNRAMAPTYQFNFVTDEEMSEFIGSNYGSDILDLYSKLQIGASRADFWRILILQSRGGVYIDVDTHLVWPLEFIIKPEYEEFYVIARDMRITNYFLASKSDNIHLKEITDKICANILEANIDDIFVLTGPVVVHDVLKDKNVNTESYRITCHSGNFTNEYFQYIDSEQGKWTRAQQKIDILKR